MGVRLTVKMKGEAGGAEKAKTVMLDEETILLGRDQSCQVVLAQQAVSRNHARISRDGTLFFVEDLGSSFGTQINGAKLPKGEKRLLRNGDVIAIAQFDVIFDRVADVSEDQSGKTMFVSRKVVKDVMKGLAAGGENAFFRVMNGPREGQKIEVADAQEYVFGRDAESADIVLQDDLVSRRHAKVRRDWSGTHVEDLDSRNGIKVNKKRTKKATLKDRDEVEIGGVKLLFIDPSEVREAPVVLPSSTGDDDEGTVSVKDDDEPAAAAAKEEPAEEPQEAPAEEPASAEAPAEEPASSEQPDPDADADAGAEGDQPANTQEDEPPSAMEPAAEASEPRKLIDFSNKQTLIVLGIVAVMVIFALVLIILLVAGA